MTYEEYQKHRMQQEELNGFIKGWGIIICHTAQQRNDTLRYLADIGFTLTATAEMHVRHNELDGNFLNPGYTGTDIHGNSIVDCYSIESVRNRPKIMFSQIDHLIYGWPEQTKEEFDRNFARLFYEGEVSA